MFCPADTGLFLTWGFLATGTGNAGTGSGDNPKLGRSRGDMAIPSAYSSSLLTHQQFGCKIADAEVLVAVKNIMIATKLVNWVSRIR